MTSKLIPERRLGQADVADLIFYWGEYESEIGVKAIDYSNVRVEGGEYVTDPLSETIFATERARRIRSKLERLSPKHQRVLYGVYGRQNRFAPFGRFGDLANIVAYTKTAQLWGGVSKIENMAKDRRNEVTLRIAAEKLLCAASSAYRSA